MTKLWIVLALLLTAASVRYLCNRLFSRRRRRITNHDIDQIIATGQIRSDEDEPLDLEHIRAEEDAFWKEERWERAGPA